MDDSHYDPQSAKNVLRSDLSVQLSKMGRLCWEGGLLARALPRDKSCDNPRSRGLGPENLV